MAGKITKVWSTEELNLLKDIFITKTTQELMQIFGCTKKHIANIAKKLKLKKRALPPSVGEKVFNLTILEMYLKLEGNGENRTYVKAECDCEKRTIVNVRLAALTSGSTKSCGCVRSKLASEKCKSVINNYKHGQAHNRIYTIWANMKKRCLNVKAFQYQDYGGRGITLCYEWREFQSFYDWAIANGYDETLTIDRIDNNGNYEPTNCRWITKRENNRNKRNTMMLTAFGETKPMRAWLEDERCVVKRGAICYRIGSGWTPEDAISKPSERAKSV